MTEHNFYDVYVPVCKPCPVCGQMPRLSRQFNHMTEGKVRTIFCRHRHYFLNTNYGNGDGNLIIVWNQLVNTHGPHRMGIMEDSCNEEV